jgi:hypothetical protein
MAGSAPRPGLALSVLLLAGCGLSGAPACNDETVVGLTKELLQQLAADALVPQTIMQQTRMAPAMWGNPDFAQIRAQATSDLQAKQVLDTIEAQLAKLQIKVDAIRTESKENATRKASCAAQFTSFMDGQRTAQDQFSYTAHYTDDGQVYVEIQE